MTTDLTLFEIGEDMQALSDLLAEVGGDVSDEEAEAAVDAWFEENGGNLAAKADGYVEIMDNFKLLASQRKKKATEMMARARHAENAAKRLI